MSATPSQSRNLWITQNGRVVCLAHGGQELQFAVARNPRKQRIITPLDDLMRFEESDEIQCEECGAPGSPAWAAAQSYEPPTKAMLNAKLRD